MSSPAALDGDAPTTPGDLEEMAADVARLAAELVRRSTGNAAVAATKTTPTDVVTETDLAAEKLIRRELERRCPGSSVIGEELDDTVGPTGVGWIVDPIDGTVNFAYDLPVLSVSIAATIEGRVVAGAVSDVIQQETFSAAVGLGARRDGRPIALRPVDELASALVMTGFAYDARLRSIQAETLTRVLPACRDIRCMGSAALNLCWVACGRADAYFERDLKVYDYAAGALIAAEAGARTRIPGPAESAGPSGRSGLDDLVLVAGPEVYGRLERLVDHPLADHPQLP